MTGLSVVPGDFSGSPTVVTSEARWLYCLGQTLDFKIRQPFLRGTLDSKIRQPFLRGTLDSKIRQPFLRGTLDSEIRQPVFVFLFFVFVFFFFFFLGYFFVPCVKFIRNSSRLPG